MVKWRVEREPKGMFNWKAVPSDGNGTIRTTTFTLAVERVQELTEKEETAMLRTLADMTAEERAGCVGMWAETEKHGRGVIINATESAYCWVVFPANGGHAGTCRNNKVTPLVDLPPAWTPDGTPVLQRAENHG